jgi:hypothetical protein
VDARWQCLACSRAMVGCSGGFDDPDEKGSSAHRGARFEHLANNLAFPDPSGRSASFSMSGSVDLTGTFSASRNQRPRLCDVSSAEPGLDGIGGGRRWRSTRAAAQMRCSSSTGRTALAPILHCRGAASRLEA